MFDLRPDIGRPDRGILSALKAEADVPSGYAFVIRGKQPCRLIEVTTSFEAVLDQLDRERAEFDARGLTSLKGDR